MKRTLLSLSFVAVAVAANAQYNAMDQISPQGASLVGMPGFGVMQIFGDFPDFSGTVVDDFQGGGVVDKVAVAYEISNSQLNFANIQGWRISIFSSVNAAAASGNSLTGDVSSTVMAHGAGTTTEIFGTGAAGRAFVTSFSGLSLGTNAGTNYIGMAPVLDFTNNGQTFILANTGGTPGGNNGVGVNPGNGFGLGNQIPVNANAAYAVNVVPEPGTMIALGAGLAALARRRRK